MCVLRTSIRMSATVNWMRKTYTQRNREQESATLRQIKLDLFVFSFQFESLSNLFVYFYQAIHFALTIMWYAIECQSNGKFMIAHFISTMSIRANAQLLSTNASLWSVEDVSLCFDNETYAHICKGVKNEERQTKDIIINSCAPITFYFINRTH